jgi:hypothetical protein
MDSTQLQTQLRNLGVRLKDPLRASLYIDYLDQAKTYFAATLKDGPDGIGAAYPFVQAALRSANLLKALAKILEFYVSPAVDSDLRRVGAAPPGNVYTYQQYFDNVILNANDATYKSNVQQFRARYPISRDALAGLFANFTRNIKLACERVYADRAMLERFYEDLFPLGFSILSLSNIKSTGSDFHRGGQQVLILTFDVMEWEVIPPGVQAPARGTLKVVYKPSDLEADCLIVGDSAPVNRALGRQFMAASLFEIYNARLQKMKTANPAFTGLPLTTYRVLPRNYISTVATPPPLPIRQAYGYLHYLANDVSGTAPEFFGWYPLASSDYLILPLEISPIDRATAIVTDFYRREGAFCAVAGSFSLEDLHIENVRVTSRRPHLIDLEISLNSAVSKIEATKLLDKYGGISGVNLDLQDSVWLVENPNSAKAGLKRVWADKYYQNRLWRVPARGQKQLVPVDRPNLVRGFNDGMAVLREGQQKGDFDDWFKRLDKVLVRYLVFATTDFKKVGTRIFMDHLPGVTLDDAQKEFLIRFLTTEYEKFSAAGNTAALPNFVALTQAQCGIDYLSLDIPIFYHRIGTTSILNSRGEEVPIPYQVTVLGPGKPPTPPTRQARVLGIGGVLGRDTFFPAPPTDSVVRQGQVVPLANAGQFEARVNTLKISISDYFGRNDGESAGAIVPIGSKGPPT